MAPFNEAIDARVGTVVDDQYRIIRFVGGGGTGRVYEAEHTVLRRRLAIKFMLPEYAANPEKLRRFQNEAASAGHLEHPNIAAVVDQGTTPEGSPYVVTEYLTGQDCGKLLLAEGPLPIERASDIVYQACIGLSVAHQSGIVHRDVKPGNLFITQAADGTDLVKILDFGTAKFRGNGVGTLGGTNTETLHYMAPEQVRDARSVDARADIWALGAMLYELITARRPFDGPDKANVVYQISFEEPEPPSEVRPGIPMGLVSAIELALEKDPERRFETVLALADAIGPFTGRPRSRFSNLAISQRPALLTPVDAAYDAAQAGVSVLTNAPVSQSIMTSRQRAYRVYTLLGLAALVGFGGGGLARKIVNHNRVEAAVAAESDYAAVPADIEDSAVMGPPAVSAVAQAMFDASVPVVAATQTSGTASTAAAPSSEPAQTTSSTPNDPIRLVRVSADAGTVKAMVERTEGSVARSAASAKQHDRPDAAKTSATATESTAPVSPRPNSGHGASIPSDTESPL